MPTEEVKEVNRTATPMLKGVKTKEQYQRSVSPVLSRQEVYLSDDTKKRVLQHTLMPQQIHTHSHTIPRGRVQREEESRKSATMAWYGETKRVSFYSYTTVNWSSSSTLMLEPVSHTLNYLSVSTSLLSLTDGLNGLSNKIAML